MDGGEKNLQTLLKTSNPQLHKGQFVFCTVKCLGEVKDAEIIGSFKEEEGLTVILPKNNADSLKLHYDFTAAWITLKVHSSLSAVGLTAAFSSALAKAGISCNVVAAYYHDHLFVPYSDKEKAVEILELMKDSV